MDAPRPFWYLAGIALIAIAGAVAYRILSPGQDVKVGAGDFSVTLGAVQENVNAAEATIQTLTQQADAQKSEIAALEQRLSEQQAENQQLLANIQKAPQVPLSLRNAAVAFQQKAARPLPHITEVDPKLIAEAQQRLSVAKQAAQKLSEMKK